MTDEHSRDRIFKAVKKRIKEIDEQERIQIVSNAIGDRRYRDLVDIIAKIESVDGWHTALEYLMKAQHQMYSSPMIIGRDKTYLEELKYREMIFDLLSCKGLEPISTNTISLLKELDNESSLVDASHVLLKRVEQSAKEQILNGDTLFFDFSENISVSQETVKLLDQARIQNAQNVSLEKNNSLFNVESLWYCEYGRLTMSTLGIKGHVVNSDVLDHILSVIQVPNSIRTKIVEVSSSRKKGHQWAHPSNSVYRKLLSHIINHELGELSLLGSRHSVPLLNALLDETLSTYNDSSTTTGFKEILDCINTHISVRSIESIIALEKSSQMKNTRVATTAILAIGNFYHESAATILTKLLCSTRNDEIVKAVTKAIENVYKKCPEADHVLLGLLDNECGNRGKLKKLYRRLSKEKPLYYH